MADKIPATASNGDTFCSSIKATNKTQYFTDSTTPGLRLRVTPNGAKLWVFGYKAKVAPEPIEKPGDNFKSRSMSLGPFKQGRNTPSDALTVKQARDRVADLKAQIRAGAAPAISRKRATADRIAAEAARKTVRDVFEEWHSEEISKRKDGGAEVRRMMEKDVLPSIGELGIEEVRKLHISAINSAVKKRGDRIAHVVFSLIRQMLGFAVEKDYIEADPSATIKKHKVGSAGVERERTLNEAELVELFKKLPASGLLGADALVIPLQLSTLCRIGELLSARWEHINFERNEWFLPDSKNSRSHIIQLSNFALQHIQQLHQLTGHTQWLYPNRSEDGHIDTKSLTKKVRDRQREAGEVLKGRSVCNAQSLMLTSGNGERWTPHDLRRTGETLMLQLGVMPEVAHRCSNHIETDKVRRTYQRYEYRKEMEEAWDRLGAYLSSLTTQGASNIVAFKRA